MTIDARPHETPTRFRWIVFSLACGTSWLLYLHRYVFALIKSELKEEWGITNTELGLLDSAFSISYMVFQVPLGILTDWVGAHLVLTGLIILWSTGLAMHAGAPTMSVMWLARATLGIGQSATYAALNRISRTWFPPSIRTTLQGWVGVFFGRIGGLSAYMLVGYFALGVLGIPWRTAVYFLAAVGLGHGILFWLLFRDRPAQHPWVNEAEAQRIAGNPSIHAELSQPAPRMRFREMFRRMSPRSIGNLLCLNLQTTLSTIADNIYSSWIPLFLSEVHHLEFKEMGIYSALPLLGGACGGVVGGWLNDLLIRLTGSRRWSRTAVGLTGKGMAGVMLLFALLWYDDPYTFCSLLFGVKFFSDWSLATSWGTVTDISGPATATVFAFNNSVATVGAIAAPAVYGAMSEHYGWIPVFVTAAVTYILCALCWLSINSNIAVIDEGESPP